MILETKIWATDLLIFFRPSQLTEQEIYTCIPTLIIHTAINISMYLIIFISPKRKLCTHKQSLPIFLLFYPWQPSVFFLPLQIYLICTFSINGIIDAWLCILLLSQHNIFRDSRCSMYQYLTLFYGWSNIPLYVYSTFCLLIHPWIRRGCFHLFWLLWTVQP